MHRRSPGNASLIIPNINLQSVRIDYKTTISGCACYQKWNDIDHILSPSMALSLLQEAQTTRGKFQLPLIVIKHNKRPKSISDFKGSRGPLGGNKISVLQDMVIKPPRGQIKRTRLHKISDMIQCTRNPSNFLFPHFPNDSIDFFITVSCNGCILFFQHRPHSKINPAYQWINCVKMHSSGRDRFLKVSPLRPRMRFSYIPTWSRLGSYSQTTRNTCFPVPRHSVAIIL